MYCKQCGTYNPEGAKFCKNCGFELENNVRENVVKPTIDNSYREKQTTTQTTNTTKSNDSSTWIGCCLCLIGIFIVFAIISSF